MPAALSKEEAAEIDAIVARRVDAALARLSPHAAQPEPQATSLATRQAMPGGVRLMFRRWFSYGNTAYQRGQIAEFTQLDAERLLSARPPAAVIVTADIPQDRVMFFGNPPVRK